jgi:hypothetical protein
VYVDIAAGPDTLQRFIEDVKHVIGQDPNSALKAKKLFVNVSAITQQGIAVTVISWYTTDDNNPEPTVLHRLNMGILQAMRMHGLLIRGEYEPVADQSGLIS